MNSIKVESTQVLSEQLKANLVALASKYHPEGVIKITPDITMTGAFTAVYTPAPQDYSPLVIHVAGGEVTGIGKRFGKEVDPRIAKLKNAFNEAKKRATAKQQAPVQQAQPVQLVQAPVQPVQAPTQNYSPIRREFTVGDRYLVVSNTLPETNKKEFFCYYDYIGSKGGAPVNQSGTPNEVIESLNRARTYLERRLTKGDSYDYAREYTQFYNELIETDKRDVKLYNKLIEILSDPKTYRPIIVKDENKTNKIETKPATPAQQAPTQSIPKNYRRIDSSKRKLYHVAGQFYPPYASVIVAVGDSPQNSEIYTEDGQKLYLGIKRYKLLRQGAQAGLQVTPVDPRNGGSKMALAYFKIELV